MPQLPPTQGFWVIKRSPPRVKISLKPSRAKACRLATHITPWTEPLAFTVEHGKGLVFHESSGYDGNALRGASTSTSAIMSGP